MRSLCLLVMLLLFGAAAEAAPKLEVTGASFVAEWTADDGTVAVSPTTRVPYVPDRSCYRWTLRFKPGHGEVALRELFELPGRAAHWGRDDPARQTSVAPDGGAAVSEIRLDREKAELSNLWCVAAGDPQGEYRISVVAGKRLLHRFIFTVGVPPVA